ncbi:ATP-binding protein [Vallicoccus soli]|uniref:ATP-binding protein n=1 Tax=Vallicoccus soli TaxID=2339232 RepID=UPI0014027CBC|nr:helix-turn-helix domain-containing protein [Vallicoccus soli]
MARPPQPSLGGQLRALRRRAGLTQEELAERAGLTAHAVSALERGTRTRPYPHTLRALLDALGADAAERAALLAAARPAPAEEREARAPLPSLDVPSTPLVGRDADVDAVLGLLAAGRRLVTVTGTGGVGKTRLAAAVAARAAGSYPDGTAAVALAAVPDPSALLPAVAAALGVPGDQGEGPAAALSAHLRPLRLLLVLDNLEHLLGDGSAAERVAALVAAAPGLAVLVTSRAPLRVRDEAEHPLRPLDVPAGRPSLAAVEASPAGALFLERVRAVAPDRPLGDADAAAVAELCRRLAGIPLALELAAARARALPPRELLARLAETTPASGGARDLPARQRTMTATLDWSHGLLPPEQQALLRALSVVQGGCSLAAAEAVGGALGVDVLPALEGLVEHSLVVAGVHEGRARYLLLEPVAEYARARLSGGELAAVRAAHRAFYLALAEEAAPEYYRGEQVAVLRRMVVEEPNLACAAEIALEDGDGEAAARIAWAMWLHCWLRGRLTLSTEPAERALGHDLVPYWRVRAHMTLGALGFAAGRRAASQEHYTAAQAAAEASGDRLGTGQAVAGHGLNALAGGDAAAAEDLFLQALVLAEGEGLQGDWLQSLVHAWLGTVRLLGGDPDGARAQALLGLERARARGDRLAAYVALYTLSEAALAVADPGGARAHLLEGIRLSAETADLANLAYFLEALAVVEAAGARHHRVAVLVGAADALREQVGRRVYGYYLPDEALRARAVEDARSALGDDAYDDTLDAGRSLTTEAAVAYALATGTDEVVL